ncbi:tetratricopeptide repeat protein [Streptomyces sp. MB09-01]|uniref:tetratricopeptide repeat protein n=1 Tax=Streptomyces sp. MB09-01 TaxID=3028666 RepID=UPI0029AB32F5|nr:tetratricopeptide repeat protein [Streptomyces sp. MB09-01]MDX3534174.1 tetratricopeptide repeat protein [Streptomyces sp. MB09-01]
MAVGRADHVSYHAASRTPASWPLLVGTIPGAARCFQRRTSLDGGSGLLVGTAGTGKTQQAAHLARTAWAEGRLDLLVWVTATGREAVLAGYAQAIAEITGSDGASPEQAAQAFLAWLRPGAGSPRRRWLVVLDGVSDPDDVRGLWPPEHPDGQTLVTTRRRDIARPGPGPGVVHVDGFTADEATAYLAEVLAASGRSGRPAELEALARALGLLPLALSQAVSHLVREDLDCATYNRLLGRDGGRPLAELVPGPGALPDGQPFGVHEAWLPSLERADRTPPAGLALPLMELAALLPSEGAPEAAFTGTAARRHMQQYRTASSTGTHGNGLRPEDVTAALRALDRHGLIGYTPQDPHRSVRVHPVLQRVTLEAVPAHRSATLAWTVGSMLVDAADGNRDDPSFAPVLVACADGLRRHAESALWTASRRNASSASLESLFADESPLGVHPLLFRVGEFLGTTGRGEAARRHFERLADEALRHQGAESSVLHGARERAAHWRGESGDPAGAAVAYAAVLADQIRVLGPGHERTITTRAELGYWRGRAGDAAGAAAAYAELIPLQQHRYGPAYPGVFENRALLARHQGESGDAYGAAIAYEVLLNDLLRHLGARGGPTLPRETFLGLVVTRPNWSDVFGAHYGHAHWRGRAGDAAGAATSLTHLLNEQVRVLGPDHPDTAATRRELARWAQYARDR